MQLDLYHQSKIQKRHITNGNCLPPMGGSGSAKPQSGLRPLCGFAPPHFAVAGLCFAKPLSATAKRQLPGTLCESLGWGN